MERPNHAQEALDAIDKGLDEVAGMSWEGLAHAIRCHTMNYTDAREHMAKWFPEFVVPDYSELGVKYDTPEPIPGC